MNENCTLFWFRRDLRLFDNRGLFEALKSESPVLCLFIFDTNILDDLNNKKDARVTFIHQNLEHIKKELVNAGSDLIIKHGKPEDFFKELIQVFNVSKIVTNEDYEPYGIERDKKIETICSENSIAFESYSDHVLFHPTAILNNQDSPYQVFTAYKNKWLSLLPQKVQEYNPSDYRENFIKVDQVEPMPSLEEFGFEASDISIPDFNIQPDLLLKYAETRNLPSVDGTSMLGPHLRFGTVSVRNLVNKVRSISPELLSELIWREFFMMLLYHYPHTVTETFKPQYANIAWRNNEHEFEKWCKGETGYPLVDAGMHQLNETGFMHNRVRMVVGSFLCKHLLIDWRWGEAYFAEKLNDFELSSNVGNWQWVAGCGCDAAPYFRIFNPTTQHKKFDPNNIYVQKWVPNEIIPPIVDHAFARKRCLETYKKALDT